MIRPAGVRPQRENRAAWRRREDIGRCHRRMTIASRRTVTGGRFEPASGVAYLACAWTCFLALWHFTGLPPWACALLAVPLGAGMVFLVAWSMD